MNSKDKLKIQVKIISDFLCPWCFIGRNELEKAMNHEKNNDKSFEIIWLPFLLDPNLDFDGKQTKLEWYVQKLGEKEKVQKMVEKMIIVKEQVGVDLSYEGKISNSLDAHTLTSLVSPEDQDQVALDLFKHYFQDKKPLTLESIQHILPDEISKQDIIDQRKETYELSKSIITNFNVTGIPFFIFGTEKNQDKFAFSGAQSPNFFQRVFDKIVELENSPDSKL